MSVPVRGAVLDNLIKRIDYTSTPNTQYVGYATPGTLTSQAGWQIQRLTLDGNSRITLIEFADGNIAFDNVWNNIASLSYS